MVGKPRNGSDRSRQAAVVTERPVGAHSSGREPLIRRMIVGGFLTGGLFAAGLALWQSVASAGNEIMPPAQRWILAALCAVIWLYAALEGWVALFEEPDQRRTLTGALILSQLGKYVPGGGIIQVTGMVAMSRNDAISTRRLALGLPVMGLSVIAVGGVALAGLSVADTTLAGWARVLCLAGLLAPTVLWRPNMERALRYVGRIVPRVPPPDDLPSQRAILVNGAWTAVSMSASAFGYALLLQPLVGGTDLASLTLSFIVAWTVGFLVLPVPGGIGIREVVLVALIGGPAGSVVGASIAHRIINIAVELTAVGGHYAFVHLRPEPERPAKG